MLLYHFEKLHVNEENAAYFESWEGGLAHEKENGKGNSSLCFLTVRKRKENIRRKNTKKCCGLYYHVPNVFSVQLCINLFVCSHHHNSPVCLNLAFQMAAYFGYSVAATDINGDK